MRSILTKEELNELSSFWNQKQNKTLSFKDIYKKSLTSKEVDFLKEIFIKKISLIDSCKIFNQEISLKFLELNLGSYRPFISNFQREFFEFEIRCRGDHFIFFIEKALLKYLINRLCGGNGKVENKKNLSLFENAISLKIVKEILNLLKIKQNSIKRSRNFLKESMLNVVFNIKLDGFSMLCGISFDEKFFEFDLTNLYDDNGILNKSIKKIICDIKLKCELKLSKFLNLKEVASLKKDTILEFKNEADLYIDDIKISQGEVKN